MLLRSTMMGLFHLFILCVEIALRGLGAHVLLLPLTNEPGLGQVNQNLSSPQGIYRDSDRRYPLGRQYLRTHLAKLSRQWLTGSQKRVFINYWSHCAQEGWDTTILLGPAVDGPRNRLPFRFALPEIAKRHFYDRVAQQQGGLRDLQPGLHRRYKKGVNPCIARSPT
ncbi:hypothetical protein N657DRAFT_641978 [Parathielavia appendiculata]|uniref:Uncharacterized protein n=1 Tax=Parathielavia appendiculata TaxID=2587402 RepID=A0AAN6Z7I8_9PEZI|nr:hypothetical protein N657DRAFT_641978 [Parathielavia appendiculata]